jgi:pyridoxamine 5'-phosphate oxidase
MQRPAWPTQTYWIQLMSEVFEDAPADASLSDPLPHDPLPLLARWLTDAHASALHNPAAVVIGTTASDGTPRARTVLCRGIDQGRGALVFYTNRDSAKGRQLAENPYASAVFYWDALARQVCAAGHVEFTSDAESDAYWASRPRLSQLAARASRQSEPIDSRSALLAQIDAEAQQFGGMHGTAPIARPSHWGGYRIVLLRLELWVGSTGRAHDRVLWTRQREGVAWRHTRLQP